MHITHELRTRRLDGLERALNATTNPGGLAMLVLTAQRTLDDLDKNQVVSVSGGSVRVGAMKLSLDDAASLAVRILKVVASVGEAGRVDLQ